LLAALTARQIRRDELAAVLALRESAGRRSFDRNAIEGEVRRYVDTWRGLLTKHVSDGRQLLREALAGPLRFTPVERTYRFDGEVSIGHLLAGVVGLPTVGSSPTPASWNQIVPWLRQIDGLRQVA
jgi:hypothetical protein